MTRFYPLSAFNDNCNDTSKCKGKDRSRSPSGMTNKKGRCNSNNSKCKGSNSNSKCKGKGKQLVLC